MNAYIALCLRPAARAVKTALSQHAPIEFDRKRCCEVNCGRAALHCLSYAIFRGHGK
jgi:hypothetical protein